MKLAMSPLLLMFVCAVSWAGGEVPWPKEDQQNISLRSMEGMWLSEHLDAPQQLFYFNLERGGISDECPFVLRAFEVNPVTKQLVSAGGGVFCSESVEAITMIMYDFDGHARNYLQIVGLRKPAHSTFGGSQLLGMILSTYGETPTMITQDTFYLSSH